MISMIIIIMIASFTDVYDALRLGDEHKNKLQATLVRNYDSLTDWLTHRSKV